MTLKLSTGIFAVCAILLGAIVVGGIYESQANSGGVMVVNRFTGAVKVCNASRCYRPETPPDFSALGSPAPIAQ